MKYIPYQSAHNRAQMLMFVGLCVCMLLTLSASWSQYADLLAQVIDEGEPTGTGAVVETNPKWVPEPDQRQRIEIIVAGVHDEMTAISKAMKYQPTALHAAAPEAPGFLRRILDEIAGWFGLEN